MNECHTENRNGIEVYNRPLTCTLVVPSARAVYSKCPIFNTALEYPQYKIEGIV